MRSFITTLAFFIFGIQVCKAQDTTIVLKESIQDKQFDEINLSGLNGWIFKQENTNGFSKINIIPQDIARTLLNLFKNAFYACTERSRSTVNQQKSQNLIPNATEVTPFQKVSPLYEPTVSVTRKKNDNHIVITVSDNGNGIPEKVKDKIFHPFFTTKPTGQGTGLGLSLSYDIVKAHGGTIQVNDISPQGTMFIITLPVNPQL